MQTNNIFVIIPAAGFGERFGDKTPKQYYPILDKTVLEHTLACFNELPFIKKIVVAHAKEDPIIHELVNNHPKIQLVVGGKIRQASVFNALCAIQDFASDEDWVLVHDGARCCLNQEDIENLIAEATTTNIGAILANRATDTIKYSENTNTITRTLDRDCVWQAQTPQIFKNHILYKALEQNIKQGVQGTDEAQAVEKLGCPVKLVQAKYPNPKLTFLRDIPQFEALLMKAEEFV